MSQEGNTMSKKNGPIIHVERGGVFRVRERTVLRYYGRTLQHLLTGPRRTPRTH